jgi:hypothetical protein
MENDRGFGKTVKEYIAKRVYKGFVERTWICLLANFFFILILMILKKNWFTKKV